jgi:thiol-activated cytolysin
MPRPSAVFDEAHPPAYVRSVDYGRILMIKMESNVDNSIDLKAAFQQGEFGGSLDMKYREVFRNSTFTVLAIGGGAETPAKMFSGVSDDSLKELEQYIATDTVYREDNRDCRSPTPSPFSRTTPWRAWAIAPTTPKPSASATGTKS